MQLKYRNRIPTVEEVDIAVTEYLKSTTDVIDGDNGETFCKIEEENGAVPADNGEEMLAAPQRLVPGLTPLAVPARRLRGKNTPLMEINKSESRDDLESSVPGIETLSFINLDQSIPVASAESTPRAPTAVFRGIGLVQEYSTGVNLQKGNLNINFQWIMWGLLPGHQTAPVLPLAAKPFDDLVPP